MIIDFHIHYTPKELARDKAIVGNKPHTLFIDGVPAYTFHDKLFSLENHIACMDMAGVDKAVISSGAGLVNDLNQCRFLNDKLKEAEECYPGRILGLAHVPPLGGKEAFSELERAAGQLHFKGVAIPSIIGETELDSQQLWPFFERVIDLGLFVFIHPALSSAIYLDYDLGRCVGREFQLVVTVIRLINGGVLDRFPDLKFIISHLGGGISALLGRIEPYQDRDFWGTAEHPRHGKLPKEPFRNYLQKIYFDTGGFFGNMNPVKCALMEISPQNILFGTDFPQEIRDGATIKNYVEGINDLPLSKVEVDSIFSGNGKKLLGIELTP